MLKNKKAVYILIPLNVLIWSFFIYRFYTAYHDADVPVSDEKIHAVKETNISDSSVYRLRLDYKDPFLKAEKHSKIVTQSAVKAEIRKEPVKVVKEIPPPVKMPEIKYFGLVKNSSTGASAALVAFNGTSKLIRVNDVIEGVTFKMFTSDSLVARYGKNRIVVRK